MDADARLADYLAGELDPDERAAFEAALAGDAALRARLAAARRADAALQHRPPTPLPEGFEARLHESIGRELQQLLPGGAGPTPVDVREAAAAELARRDELAARRAARTAPRWTAVAGAAAVLALVAGVAGLVSLGGGDDQRATSDMAAPADDAGDDGIEMFADEARPESDSAETFDQPDADAGMADDGMAEEESSAADVAPPPRPVVLGPEREVDDAGLDALLFAPELRAFADARLEASVGDGAAAEFLDAWAAGDVDRVGPVDDDEAGAIQRCVAEAITDDGGAIPVVAELVTRDGTEHAIALGLVVRDPATDRYEQTAVLLLDRDTCALLDQRP